MSEELGRKRDRLREGLGKEAEGCVAIRGGLPSEAATQAAHKKAPARSALHSRFDDFEWHTLPRQ